jgi:hypothetical protein
VVLVRSVRHTVVLLLIGAAVLVTGACTHKSAFDFPPPPKVIDDSSSTVPDYSGVRLANVPGRTTTSIDNGPGQAHLSGTVQAPDGLVPGATVHVERLVGDASVATDVATNPDGTWRLDNIKGGRYRVRAFRAPDLAQTDPQVFFLTGDENKALTLQVQHFNGTGVTPGIAPNPPRVGQAANLAVQVTAVVVDPTGIVRMAPQDNVQVDLSGGGNWQIQSSPTQFTGANGSAVWRVVCGSTGVQPLTATVAGQPYPLNIPACQEPAPQTFSTSPSPTSFSRTSTTASH